MAWLYIHMSVTRWDVTPRNASLGLQRLYSGNIFGKRYYGDVILTSIRVLQREGTRGAPRKKDSGAPQSFGAIKPAYYKLIDLYDLILMITPPMLLVGPYRAGWGRATAIARLGVHVHVRIN
jgi:hypothetical protein